MNDIDKAIERLSNAASLAEECATSSRFDDYTCAVLTAARLEAELVVSKLIADGAVPSDELGLQCGFPRLWRQLIARRAKNHQP